jgi:hypothetical protein
VNKKPRICERESRRHLVQHATVTLRKLEKISEARTKKETIELRREKVLEWQADEGMDWLSNKLCFY